MKNNCSILLFLLLLCFNEISAKEYKFQLIEENCYKDYYLLVFSDSTFDYFPTKQNSIEIIVSKYNSRQVKNNMNLKRLEIDTIIPLTLISIPDTTKFTISNELLDEEYGYKNSLNPGQGSRFVGLYEVVKKGYIQLLLPCYFSEDIICYDGKLYYISPND